MKNKNIETGYLYFYVHLITELICFFSLYRIVGDSILLWIIPLVYDALAFLPQGLIGYVYDKYKNFSPGLIGVFLLILGILFFPYKIKMISIIIIAIGNAFIHVNGAEVTLRTSSGKMSSASIFVGGGSFGVVLGKLLATTSMNLYVLILLALSMIPFIMLANTYYDKEKDNCNNYDYANKMINPIIVILLSTFIVIVRGYMGYGIPTSWNKTVIQTIMLYSFMGIGKCLGGILVDKIGIRKTSYISLLGAIPFLVFGDKLMVVSLIGVMFFSMTMSITLALLVSVIKDKPGLAFGFTTIGLFLGTLPIFFFTIKSIYINIAIIVFFSIICLLIVNKIIRKD